MHRHMNAIILVARASEVIVEAVRIRVGVTVLLLFQCKKIVGGNTFDDVRSTRTLDRFNDRSDRDLVLLNEGRRRDGIVSWLKFVDTFDE